MGGRPDERCVVQCSGKIWECYALEFSGLNSCFQGLKFAWWWDTAPMKDIMNKEFLERHGQDSG